MNFKKLTAVLDLKDKVLQIYYNEDLQEIILLSNLEDYYEMICLNSEDFELNLYKDKEGYKLTLYEVYYDNEDRLVTDKNKFKKIELRVN